MPDAVDFSVYVTNTGDLPPDGPACLQRNGVRRVMIGTRGNRLKFVQQAQACLNEGMEVHAYVYLYWNEPGTTQGMNALSLVSQVPEIKVVWLDVEYDDAHGNPISGDPLATLKGAASVLGAYRVGIYTSRSMWQQVMADTAEFKDWPLWDAGGFKGSLFYAYGGWTQRVMHQYTGSYDLCDMNVDLDEIEEERMYTDAEIDAKVGALVLALAEERKQLNDLGNAVNALPPLKDQLKYLYALGGKPWPFGP